MTPPVSAQEARDGINDAIALIECFRVQDIHGAKAIIAANFPDEMPDDPDPDPIHLISSLAMVGVALESMVREACGIPPDLLTPALRVVMQRRVEAGIKRHGLRDE